MTDLQKDQAIYQALCEIADKYFNRAIECDKMFRKFMAEKNIVTPKELSDLQQYRNAVGCYETVNNTPFYEEHEITVDTFKCKFGGADVFRIMQQFKSLAKAKGDHCFTYEEVIPNDFIGTVEITFDNPANAKNLVNHAEADESLRPILEHILLEINTLTGDINFIATDGRTLSVISNDIKSAVKTPKDERRVFQALFTKSDWKRICDYARKAKSRVTFEIYRRMKVVNKNIKGLVDEAQDTMCAVLGDVKVRSVVMPSRYPNWRSVIQKNADKHFAIHPDDVKAAQSFIHGIKVPGADKERQNIFVSFYHGSDIAYFDFFDREYDVSKTASFRLTKPATITIGTCFNIKRLQKVKFTGFNIEASARPSLLDSEDTDIVLIMPVLSEEGYVFNVDERERIEAVAA